MIVCINVKNLLNYTLISKKIFKGVSIYENQKKLKKSYLTSFKADEPTIQELRNIAKNLGIKLKRNMKKKTY